MKAGIVGAGIMGQLLALNLLSLDWDITLYDQNIENSCSKAAAGLLTPVAELEKNDRVIYDLGVESLQQHWPAILSMLKSKIYFRQQGSLLVAHPNDKSELIRFLQFIRQKINKPEIYQTLSAAEIKQLEPDLEKFSTGYYFPLEGQIDNQVFLSSMENEFAAKINWRKSSLVTQIKPHAIFSQQGEENFDYIFDCRGTAATSTFNDLRSVRGELIWLHAPDVHITRPTRFLHPHYNLYVVPRNDQIYLIGASEIEANDQSNISVRTTLELLTAAYYLQPKFAEARIIKTATHCRPVLANHLPKIKYTKNFFAINGLYRHGFLIAPTLAHEVTQFIQRGFSALRYPQLWEKVS